jgi:hypothetical protein
VRRLDGAFRFDDRSDSKNKARQAAALQREPTEPGHKASQQQVRHTERFILQKLINTSSLIVLLLLISATVVTAQGRKPVTPPASSITSYLPASDVVAIVDVKRMLNETMPSILGGDPAKLAQANAEVDKFKTKTGVDLRSINRVSIGIRYTYPDAKLIKFETVAIGSGSFDSRSIAASAQSVANGKARAEKYKGVNITTIDVNDDVKLLGLWNMRINELAICVLDPNTLALGSPANVRAAIDAGKAGRAPADLIALATRDQHAVAGFGANLTPELLTKLELGNDTIAKDVSAIKQVYGSVGSAEGNVALTVVARTASAEAATNLRDTVDGFRQAGGIIIMGMAEPRKTVAAGALNNMKITPRGNEVEISTQVTAASLAALIK